jgi:gamma-glutamylcyclotransferase (GGCT)/AIG2-like uncharacterized protein YtfP
VGELYRLDRALLSRLDSIEGYNRENERDSLFVRQSVIARRFADGSEVEAYSYFFNSYADNRIGHGDYRRHQLEQCEGDRWVLAYGSNLSLARLADRVGTVREIQKGYIAEFDLAFNKRADRRTRKSYANITFSGVQGRCPAVAYKLTAEQIETLDGHEGVPDNYSRISVSFSAESGESRIVETYIASPDALLANASPRADYLDHIMKGYADHAFDSQYLMSVVGRLGDR